MSQVDEKQAVGLECVKCGCRHFYVHWTQQKNGYIERKRICRHCDKWVITREKIVT